MTHTPTPWTWKVKNGNCIYPAKGFSSLAMCELDGNAEFIVKCVNNHDALVEALENLIAYGAQEDTIAPARAVLAAIKS